MFMSCFTCLELKQQDDESEMLVSTTASVDPKQGMSYNVELQYYTDGVLLSLTLHKINNDLTIISFC